MPHTIILRGPSQRQLAARAIATAPDNHVVTIKPMTRNGEQNARMWAMLSDVSRSKPEGRSWTTEAWKCAFMHARGWQVQFAEPLDGEGGPFPIGFRTSKLTVRQMADLITTIQEYGDRHGIEWTEKHPDERSAA